MRLLNLPDEILLIIHLFNSGQILQLLCRHLYYLFKRNRGSKNKFYLSKIVSINIHDSSDIYILEKYNTSCLSNIYIDLSKKMNINVLKKAIYIILHLKAVSYLTINLSNNILGDTVYDTLLTLNNLKYLDVLQLMLNGTHITSGQLFMLTKLREIRINKLYLYLENNKMDTNSCSMLYMLHDSKIANLYLNLSNNKNIDYNTLYLYFLVYKFNYFHFILKKNNIKIFNISNTCVKNMHIDLSFNNVDLFICNHHNIKNLDLNMSDNKLNVLYIRDVENLYLNISQCKISYDLLKNVNNIENIIIDTWNASGLHKIKDKQAEKKYRNIKFIENIKTENVYRNISNEYLYVYLKNKEEMEFLLDFCYSNFKLLCVLTHNNKKKEIMINKNCGNFMNNIFYDETKYNINIFKIKELEKLTGGTFYYKNNYGVCNNNGIMYNYNCNVYKNKLANKKIDKIEYYFILSDKYADRYHKRNLLYKYKKRNIASKMDILCNFIKKNKRETIFGDIIDLNKIIIKYISDYTLHNSLNTNYNHLGCDHISIYLPVYLNINISKYCNLNKYLSNIFNLKYKKFDNLHEFFYGIDNEKSSNTQIYCKFFR